MALLVYMSDSSGQATSFMFSVFIDLSLFNSGFLSSMYLMVVPFIT